jgi:hypothetical protein
MFKSMNEIINRENIYNMHCAATGRICLSQMKQTAFISDVANSRIVALNLSYVSNKKIHNMIKLDHKVKLSRPWAITYDEKNDLLYVGDFMAQKIYVFTVNHDAMKKVKEIEDWHLDKIDALEIDNTENLLYVAETIKNQITIWSTSTFSFIETKMIDTPSMIRVKEKCMYVASSTESEFAGRMKTTINTNSVGGCITLYNRYTWAILKTINLADWSNPRGLYIDDNFNVITVASLKKVEKGVAKNIEHLFILDPNGFQKQRLRLNFDKVYDFCISNRNIVFVRGDENPPVVIMDFI